jgi:cytochrome c oxidase cbb3-type subunit 2
MAESSHASPLRFSWFTALLAIAATYFYFLIFAEFAFLELARTHAPDSRSLRVVMTALGAGGIIGASLGAWLFRANRAHTLLAWTLRACAVSALVAVRADGVAGMSGAAFIIGISLGALTVVLASSLRAMAGRQRLGLCIGAGTGLAYGLSNLPWVFRASPSAQTALAAIGVAAVSFLPRRPGLDAGAVVEIPDGFATVTRWLTILLALVWMDSAAFYVVQHTPALRETTWQTTESLLANALIHVGAALLAGACLDRGWRAGVAGVAAVALATACLVLGGTVPAFVPPGWLYTAGVSLYSTVLVEFPARDGRPAVAALVFAVAGWVGSALGIGMAQDLATVPVGFVAAATAVVGLALAWRARPRTATTLGLLGFAVVLPDGRADEIARGREIYIAEGCIHCHSQYVRPNHAIDVERWGPAVRLEETLQAAPPLFGMRRLGPDLSQVGNRRSAEWNRLHLIAPQAVSPGSRMPSYAHLFAHGDSRGDDLVAYLATLGEANLAQRWAEIAAWRPRPTRGISPRQARRLFLRLCLPCHGETGRGDGPLAAGLSLRPADWLYAPWRHVPSDRSAELVVSRIIKFGLPGLPMAGHEYLPDDEIVGLARYVRSLHNTNGGGPAAAVQP